MAVGEALEQKNEEANVTDMQKVTDAHQKTFTLEILHIIKDAQQHHGLRHGDYQRYRSYCSRKLRRIRKSLHFVQASKHRFQSKKITQDVLTDVRFLHIPLMMCERAWGYAMQLKQEANTEPRKRFHLVSRLQKASKIACDLESLCDSSKCDARTKLEAQAYSAWIKGSLYFELQQWQSAMEFFRVSQTIYEKLSEALNEDEVVLYKQRVEELIPNIRYCAYNIGDETAINDLMQMRLAGKTSGEDILASDLDHLIAQTREKQAVTLSEVEWLNRKIPVRHERIRLFLLNVQDAQVQVDKAPDLQAKIAVYERLLLDCKDALQVVRDEMKGDQTLKTRSEATQSSLTFLHSYLTYIRLSKTVERNLLLIESLKQNMTVDGEVLENKRPTKAQDLVRPYEIIIQNLHEITQLPGIENDANFLEEMEASVLFYKAHRCYYIAEVYSAASKWAEAMALYDRADDYSKQALSQKALKKDKELVTSLKELSTRIEGNKYNAYSLSILGNREVASPSAELTKKNLMERLDEYYEDPKLVSRQPQIAQFPPDFKPVPCKPLFFDLALNQVEFPSLEDKIEPNKKGGGITNFVRGWLGGWK